MAKNPEAKKVGRSSKLTPETGEIICAEIASGKSSAEACKVVGVDARTMLRWVADNEEFRQMYAHAREAQADKYAGEIVEIADELTVEAKYSGEDVTLDVSASAVARNRLRVDARKWIAAKLLPKKYGERLALDADVNITKRLADMTDDELLLIATQKQKA